MSANPTASVIETLVESDRGHIVHPFSALHTQQQKELAIFESAAGIWLTSKSGERYIDAAGGLWCVNTGYGRQEIADAAARQMVSTGFLHSFANFTHEPQIHLTEKLLSLLPRNFSRVFYGLSGSDANDTQVKLIWRYNNIVGRPKKKIIISRILGYHGATVIAGSLSGIPDVYRTFDMPRPGFLHTLAADWHRRPAHINDEEHYSRYLAEELENLIVSVGGAETVAAFVAEPVHGSGGVMPPPRNYFREINAVLNKYDVLMVADEVITGFGRTGHWFASPALEVQPDLMTLSKGLSGGYFPMSAVVVSTKVAEVLYSEKAADGAFAHGFTFSGHPVGAAVALCNIGIMERERLPENAGKVGQHLIARLRERLMERQFVSDIRGMGLLLAVELDKDKKSRTIFPEASKAQSFIIQACFEENLIVRGARGRSVIGMAPPLILTFDEADQIVDRIDRAISRFDQAARAGMFG